MSTGSDRLANLEYKNDVMLVIQFNMKIKDMGWLPSKNKK